MTGADARDPLRCESPRLHLHRSLPVLPVAVLDDERDRRAERLAAADAADDPGRVVLDLLAFTPPVSTLTAAEVGVDVAGGVERHAGRQALDDHRELRAVRFAGREKSKHLQRIVLASADFPVRAARIASAICPRQVLGSATKTGGDERSAAHRDERARAPAHRPAARRPRRCDRGDLRVPRGDAREGPRPPPRGAARGSPPWPGAAEPRAGPGSETGGARWRARGTGGAFMVVEQLVVEGLGLGDTVEHLDAIPPGGLDLDVARRR